MIWESNKDVKWLAGYVFRNKKYVNTALSEFLINVGANLVKHITVHNENVCQSI